MKNPHVGKRQLEQHRRERAAQKRQRRIDRHEAASAAAPVTPRDDQSDTLQALADLHRAYEDGGIAFEQFEAVKQDLMSRLDVG